MSDIKQETGDIAIFEAFIKLFKRKRKVKKGDLGVYHDTISYTTIGNSSRTLHCNVFIKVEAVEVFEDLVEVQVIDIKIIESVSEDMTNFIKQVDIKYLNPNQVKWRI